MREAPVAKPITESEAAEIARRLFGIEAAAHALAGEYDDNFRLREGDGGEFVLKIMHSYRERSFVEMQCAVLQHLVTTAGELPLPRVVPSLRGESCVQTKVNDGSQRIVWLLTYLYGKTLAEFQPHTPELLEELGHFLGKLSCGLTDFSHPAAQDTRLFAVRRAGAAADAAAEISRTVRNGRGAEARQPSQKRGLWRRE